MLMIYVTSFVKVNHDFQKSTFSKRYLDNGLKSNEDVKKLNPETLIYAKRYFRDCIIHHQQIIKLVEIVESEFNYLMLIQFLGSLLLLCLSLFQLSINDIRSTRFFSMLCFACLMLFQLLIFCWNGNEVLVESLEIAFAAYDSDWFVCDIATQKAVVLVIQRAQRALQLSAGKFAYLTLETYMSILRASGSYYMVLRKVNE
ncbi:7tm Odorant receptor [Popillia japonica]|uniref:7tm Odorant receptor n=1 Tax=Popillia japonica TaxID=7064 RepID=A0AAW1MZM8_POPJA